MAESYRTTPPPARTAPGDVTTYDVDDHSKGDDEFAAYDGDAHGQEYITDLPGDDMRDGETLCLDNGDGDYVDGAFMTKYEVKTPWPCNTEM